MKNPKSSFRIYIALYDVDLRIYITNDKQYIKRLVESHNGEHKENDFTCTANSILHESRAFMQFNPDKLNEGAIVHECDHIVHQVLRDVGVKESDESEEAYAYFLEWLYKQVIKLIRNSGHIISDS